jgi:SpoIID/LytB domain protein
MSYRDRTQVNIAPLAELFVGRRSRDRRKTRWRRLSLTAISAFTLLCGAATFPDAARASQSNRLMEIGVIQRFGSKETRDLILKPLAGNTLYLRFEGGDGNPKTLEAEQVKIELENQPLPEPQIEERVVLSIHRSFENAEQSAQEWQQQGIEVELASPGGRWQVWAKRDVYNTPLLRRLLLQSLQTNGHELTFLNTEVNKSIPHLSWTLDGFRYHRRVLEISASNDRIQVARGEKDPEPRLYGGELRLQPDAYGTYTLVNEVPLESYLRGVVPHEIGAGAPDAAVEAQAILARTYALRNLRRFETDGYELCASSACQVYKGLGNTWEPADRAIAATAGKVLTYNNELVDALYSSTSGGVTSPYTDMWDGSDRPYLQTRLDAVTNVWDLGRNSLSDEQNFRRFIGLKQGFNEDKTDLFRWREESKLADMNKDLKDYLQSKNHPLRNFKTIREARVVKRSPSGRAIELTVTTDLGSVTLRKDEILQAFYAPLSTLFYLEPMYDKDKKLEGYAFVGGGFGHGVGLSQFGAHNLARLGWTSDRILTFYFPGTEVRPIDREIVFWQDPQRGREEEF